MFHAVSFALVDSLNALLIGVIVGLGVMLPARANYRRIAFLVVVGDWLGVLSLSVLTMLVFDGLGDAIQRALDSPVFAILLIATGLLTLILTLLSKGDGDGELMKKIMRPLNKPSPKTMAMGFALGVIQSATSVPFFSGLAYLSASDYGTTVRYVGLIFYASLALSLPALSAIFVGLVRARPESPFGRAFAYMRERKQKMAMFAGYIVAAVLMVFGTASLF